MHIRYAYLIELETAGRAEVSVRLDVHPDQRGDITQPDEMRCEALPDGSAVECSRPETDRHGNLVRRISTPSGALRLRGEGVLFHSGFPDPMRREGRIAPPSELPADVLPFLLASPCCPTAELADQALSLFRNGPQGWGRVEAVCEYIRQTMRFAPDDPLSNRPVDEALAAGAGSIRDFAHAAIAFCRCLDIPARYCTGYLPGPAGARGDLENGFCAWFEVYLDGRWWTFDARHGDIRIGRILVARGFDAAETPLFAAAAPIRITRLACHAEPIEGARYPATSQDRNDHWQAQNARSDS